MSASGADFSAILSSPALQKLLAEAGHEMPSYFQQQCIPHLLSGRDLLGLADVGTGKTLSFVLPMLQKIDSTQPQTQVLVLTPSDEFALHVAEVFQHFAKYLADFRVHPIHHQTSVLQLRQLHRGAHVIIGTPRRIVQARENQDICLDQLRTVVLDELDHQLKAGFADDIEAAIALVPQPRQLVVFAAMMTPSVLMFARQHLQSPLFLMGTEKSVATPLLRQRYWQVEVQGKLAALTRLFDVEHHFDSALIFVADKARAGELSEKLLAHGYSAAALDAQMSEDERANVARQFSDGNLDLIVSTDLAAAHLNLERLSHVVSYDIPHDVASHVHRIQHLAGGSYQGSAILLITPPEHGMLHSIERATHQRITKLELPERVR